MYATRINFKRFAKSSGENRRRINAEKFIKEKNKHALKRVRKKTSSFDLCLKYMEIFVFDTLTYL